MSFRKNLVNDRISLRQDIIKSELKLSHECLDPYRKILDKWTTSRNQEEMENALCDLILPHRKWDTFEATYKVIQDFLKESRTSQATLQQTFFTASHFTEIVKKLKAVRVFVGQSEVKDVISFVQQKNLVEEKSLYYYTIAQRTQFVEIYPTVAQHLTDHQAWEHKMSHLEKEYEPSRPFVEELRRHYTLLDLLKQEAPLVIKQLEIENKWLKHQIVLQAIAEIHANQQELETYTKSFNYSIQQLYKKDQANFEKSVSQLLLHEKPFIALQKAFTRLKLSEVSLEQKDFFEKFHNKLALYQQNLNYMQNSKLVVGKMLEIRALAKSFENMAISIELRQESAVKLICLVGDIEAFGEELLSINNTGLKLSCFNKLIYTYREELMGYLSQAHEIAHIDQDLVEIFDIPSDIIISPTVYSMKNPFRQFSGSATEMSIVPSLPSSEISALPQKRS